jgi:hypothetical protein
MTLGQNMYIVCHLWYFLSYFVRWELRFVIYPSSLKNNACKFSLKGTEPLKNKIM